MPLNRPMPSSRSSPPSFFTALWAFDEASDEHRAIVRSVIPNLIAWVIETVATRSYERRAWRCWYLPQHTRLSGELNGQISVEIAAPIEAAWKLVANPLRVPEWSHECRGVRLLDGATSAGLRRRFRGTNRALPSGNA
jgi:hypothetical protein